MPEINKDLKILIVEDNIVNQKIIALFIEKLGLKADVANNGTEAIQLAKDNSYDLILMDVIMPGIDGIETTKIIRQELPQEQQPHIYGISADANLEKQELCLEAGMNNLISKPIEPEALTGLTDCLEKISSRE